MRRPTRIVGSSTSGIKPTDMQMAMKKHPERLVVGHPFNPVYLLPLVEIVGGEQTLPEAIEVAKEIYASIGMKPVVIRKEIEAFVGDRLLEAAWREALWLIKDGICTVEELDDIMRYGFGLRWAQMGMFQVYRVAGGEAGMRHFMAQFGPCLKWPWTKLMDVPEFNDELVDLIATQSDDQAHGLSIRELEKIRDDNLVAIMEALSKQNKGKGWGAGELHKDYTKQLAKLAAKKPKASKAAEKAKASKPVKKAEKPKRNGQEEGLRRMDFGLSEEQKLIVETTRAFVENELYPHEREVERTGHLRRELIEEIKAKAIEAGLYAANMPADVGGAGLDTVTWLLYEKELGRANYALHWTCVARPSNILLAGTPEQREKYLFPCIRGEKWDCLAMTEPGAGSDLRGMKASAVQDGDDWVLNGTKHFISHADIADFAIVFMASGEEDSPRGKRKKITAFFVDKGTKGFTVRDGYRNVSHRGYTNSILEFDDCRLPKEPGSRRGAQGLRGRQFLARRDAPAGRRHLPRPRRAGAGHADRICRAARAVRPADRQVPGRVVQARRHGDGVEGGRPDGVRGRLEIRPGHGHRPGHGDGQAEGHRDAGLRRRRGDPDPWRHGADGRPAAGAHLARRARRAHLGRHLAKSSATSFRGRCCGRSGAEPDEPPRTPAAPEIHRRVSAVAQAAAVVKQSLKMGFAGDIWPVHPTKDEVAGVKAYRTVAELPGAPDAAFIGVNRHLTIEMVKALARTRRRRRDLLCRRVSSRPGTMMRMASGCRRELIEAAGDMPIIGPNCYGLINYADGALLWPDQHGGIRLAEGAHGRRPSSRSRPTSPST